MSKRIVDLEEKIENVVKKSMLTFPKNSTILAGISGGIDSMTLLFLMNKVAKESGYRIHVLTVNHNIRPMEESDGDAQLVKGFCNTHGIECTIIEFKKGIVKSLADSRQKGIEEAARYLRYEAFESYAEKTKAVAFFLAHHQDDQIETLLQRFFQGSFGMSACGILENRSIYVRPFLQISRLEIERYAKKNKIDFRVDSTNNNTQYYRNKLRNIVIPLLDKVLEGWRASVLHGREKQFLDAEYLDQLADTFIINEELNKDERIFWLNYQDFCNQNIALKIRIVYKILALLKVKRRIPYEFVKQICSGWTGTEYGLSIQNKDGKLIFENSHFSRNSFEYFGIIKKSGKYKTKLVDLDFKDENLPVYVEITSKKKTIKRI